MENNEQLLYLDVLVIGVISYCTNKLEGLWKEKVSCVTHNVTNSDQSVGVMKAPKV